MAYTIKGLAKANECATCDCQGLADVWNYWLLCNRNDMQSVRDFKSLRVSDRMAMLNFLRSESCYGALYAHICERMCV